MLRTTIAALFALAALLLPAPSGASERDARIAVDGVEIAVTVRVPEGTTAPVPAVVLVHGSGKGTRDWLRGLGDRVLASGFAVLTFDKRGAGESGGRYRDVNAKSSLEVIPQLAADVRAASRWLASQPSVDSSRIGLAGGSQAGWIIPLAAVDEPLIRFAVIFSGPVVTVGREIAYSRLAGADPGSRKGLSDDEVVRGMARFKGPDGFDPLPVLERLDIPVLWIQGEKDRSLPMAETLAELERLRTASKRPFEVHVIEGADHGLRNVDTGEPTPVWPIAEAWLRRLGVLP